MCKKNIFTAPALCLSALLLISCAGKAAPPIAETNEIKYVLESEQPLHPANLPTEESLPPKSAPVISEADWSKYFDGMTGSAVILVPNESRYIIYNEELSNIKRSPCSTFKIISSLAGIEHGVINPEDSVRVWSGERFWNEKWNRDIGFKDAFASSCIWYFREVINELGPEIIQAELSKLNYGNCDISDWEGRLNNNNNNRSLTGFWVESSLKISPREQTEVMERIFNANSAYSKKNLSVLKEAMLVTDLDTSDIKVFGKTGLGKTSGVTVDAWFTGFAVLEDETIYFCVYLGESEGMDVTSIQAKKIAMEIIGDYFALKNGL